MVVYVVQVWLNYPPSGLPPGWYTVDADDDYTAAHLKAAQRSNQTRVVMLTGTPTELPFFFLEPLSDPSSPPENIR